MRNATLPATRSGYFHVSRAPRYSLTFVLPLLVLYEVLAVLVNQDVTQGLRNGADVLLKSLFVALAGTRGPLIFGVILVGIIAWLVIRDRRSNPGPLRLRIFAGMMAEAVVLALALGVVVGMITAQLVNAIPGLAAGPFDEEGWVAGLMISLGAGLYEELLFRVLLVSALLLLARRLFRLAPVASGVVAVLGGALIFSTFHYIGPYGDALEVGSFVFRTVAGLVFSGLYVTRGFGITAWTHALYDVFLITAQR
ncbi:MAG TPA: CPBP family glutamic-type intramembrane protease [Gemmatimonadaceae bacterium]|nr:CPBP family glutamic-type intramembrane protease [Gemmatimonadaceae bacterium]